MLETAVLEQMTGSLCAALTGLDGQATLEALERNNLFVVALDDQRRWYRYHHLFAEALRARLAAEQPDRVSALHAAASEWYADQGLLDEAVAHALAAGASERAADLIERAMPELRRNRQDRALRGWLEALPDEVVREARCSARRPHGRGSSPVTSTASGALAGRGASPARRRARGPGSRSSVPRPRRRAAMRTARRRTPAARSSWPAPTTTSLARAARVSSGCRRGRRGTSRRPSTHSRRR